METLDKILAELIKIREHLDRQERHMIEAIKKAEIMQEEEKKKMDSLLAGGLGEFLKQTAGEVLGEVHHEA